MRNTEKRKTCAPTPCRHNQQNPDVETLVFQKEIVREGEKKDGGVTVD